MMGMMMMTRRGWVEDDGNVDDDLDEDNEENDDGKGLVFPSLEATLVRNSAKRLTDSPTWVNCRASSVAKR